MKWDDFSLLQKMQSVRVMDAYVKKHAEPLCVKYWNDEISKISPAACSLCDDIIRMIVSDDEKYASILFAFYIAVTTDTSWMDQIVKAM